MWNTTSRKFIIGLAVIIAVAGVLFIVASVFAPEARQERQAQKYLDDLRQQYENDTYGGETPEETLALFIAALEVGDIELASMYFLPDDREEQKKYFQEIKEADKWEQVIADANSLQLSKKDEKEAFFTLVNEENVVEVQVVLGRNKNRIWKILEL